MDKKILFNDRGVNVTQDMIEAVRWAEQHTAQCEKQNPPIKYEEELAPDKANLPHISIGLITFRRDNLLKLGLNSIVYSDYPRDKIELIVLNDGTGPSTRNIVKLFTPHIKIKYFEIPLSAKPYPYYYDMRRKNFLIKQSSHDIIYLTQAEIIHSPSCFMQVAAAFQRHGGHIKVKPKLIEQAHECKGNVPGVNGDVAGKIDYNGLWKAAYAGQGFRWSANQWSGSFGGAMRLASWNELGGFEEDVQISSEAEIDSRINRRKWKMIELHKAHMIHLEHEREFKGDKWTDALRRVGKTPLKANTNKEWGVIKEAKLVSI